MAMAVVAVAGGPCAVQMVLMLRGVVVVMPVAVAVVAVVAVVVVVVVVVEVVRLFRRLPPRHAQEGPRASGRGREGGEPHAR